MDHKSNEDAFNQPCIWPYLYLIGKSLKVHDCEGRVVQGEPFLNSMTQRLKTTGAFFFGREIEVQNGRLDKTFQVKEIRTAFAGNIRSFFQTMTA